ncbi:MAG: 3'-5' exonuclease [Verrucomicrobiota bacterium]
MTLPTTISKEELRELPLFSFTGRIHLPTTRQELEDVATELRRHKVIGFDTETRPSFKKGQSYLPSLVQLGTETDAYLFQLKKIETLAPLIEILESPATIKTGVALDRDVKELQEYTPFDAKGFFELTNVARDAGMEKTGLRNLCGMLLGHRISKRAQTSNWARVELTPEQITYAATDAWVSLKLFQRLKEQRPDLF